MSFISTIGFKINVLITFLYFIPFLTYSVKTQWGQRYRKLSLYFFLISLIGTALGPFIYHMNESWKFWMLFCGGVLGLKQLAIYCIVREDLGRLDKSYVILSVLITVLLGFHVLMHIDYVITKTDYLVPYFSSVVRGAEATVTIVLLWPLISLFWSRLGRFFRWN